MRYEDLFQAGSIINLHIGKWRARAKVTFQDLGIEGTPEVKKALSLGSHRLAPQEEFAAINAAESSAKRCVEAHSVTFAMVPGARFVPNDLRSRLVDELRMHRDAFENAADAFAVRYEEMRDAQLPIIETALREAAKTHADGRLALDRVRDLYPSREEVRAEFDMDWAIYGITAPENVADEIAAEGDNVRSVVRDMIERLRVELAERVDKLLRSVDKGGKLPAISIGPTHQLLNRLDKMNVAGDEALDAQIVALRACLTAWERGETQQASLTAWERGETSGVGVSLGEIRDALDASAEEAVKAAEAKLGGVGRRRLGLVGGGG